MTYQGPGGRIPPDNRPVQAKGVGRNSKRHDLERRTTPFLHGSDLQVGDVQAMEQGQRIAPKKTQQPARPAPAGGGGQPTATTSPATIPDAIDFISGIAGGGSLTPPPAGATPSYNLEKWLRYATHLVNGPGSSGLLAGAYINQMRQLRRSPQNSGVEIVNLQDVDAALAAALNEEEAIDGSRAGS
jgi:hypothetical protein